MISNAKQANSVISWREQVNFRRNDDICLNLTQSQPIICSLIFSGEGTNVKNPANITQS